MSYPRKIGFFCHCCFAAVVTVALPTSAVGQDTNLDLPFFRELWAGSAFDELPEGISDPSVLRRSFAAEPRVVDWATGAESEIDRAISRIQSGRVTARSVRCNSSICEVIFVIPDASIRSEAELGEEIDRSLGAAAMVLDKELTMAMGGGRPAVTGVLAYFHDDRETPK